MQLLENMIYSKRIIINFRAMKKWIKQITEWEIYEIRILLKEWNSIPQTALKVWRHKSTIYRLLSNNDVKYN